MNTCKECKSSWMNSKKKAGEADPLRLFSYIENLS